LPDGARRFATHPSHYDYYAYRTLDSDLPPESPLCTKDLLLRSAEVAPAEELGLVLSFLYPGFEFADVGSFDLVLRYRHVTRFTIEESEGHPRRVPSGLSHLMMDEVVPQGDGIIHHLVFEHGAVTVIAADVEAIWR